jgi:hypothetical protein
VQAKRGGLRDTDATDLLATVFKAVLNKTSLDPKVFIHGISFLFRQLVLKVVHAVLRAAGP